MTGIAALIALGAACNLSAPQRAEFSEATIKPLPAGFAELGDSEQAQRKAALERQRLALILPLREIFDERLKPGLEKLPTREQRAAAGNNR